MTFQLFTPATSESDLRATILGLKLSKILTRRLSEPGAALQTALADSVYRSQFPRRISTSGVVRRTLERRGAVDSGKLSEQDRYGLHHGRAGD
jgi:hypothetical protein